MDMSQFKDVFLGEAQEILVRVESTLVDLAKDPADASKLQSAFRDFHTLKGNAATMGLHTFAELAHAVENLLDGVNQSKKPLPATALQAIQESMGLLRPLIEDFRAGRDSVLDANPLVAKIKAASAGFPTPS